MWSIQFESPPAAVTVGEGVSAAARYWRETLELWILPVVAVGIIGGAATWLLGSVALDQATISSDIRERGDIVAVLQLVLPQILVLTAVTTVVAILASWVYVAIAIAGLRGRVLTAGWIVGAGLRTLVAGIIQTAAVLAAFGLAILLGGPLALILILVLIVPAIYVSLRLTFWQYAIFDGDGIIPGLRTTWAITRGGVLRIAGWGLAIAGISLLVRIGVGVATALLRDDLAPVAAGISALSDAAFAAFQVIVIAILYESQRLRHLPQPPPAPGAVRTP